MLRDLAAEASALLQLRDATALRALEAALDDGWRDELAPLLAGDWHAQLVAAAAMAIGGHAADGDVSAVSAGTAGAARERAQVATVDESARLASRLVDLWRAIDGASWVAPQLVACAFLVDPAFLARAEERLLGVERRPPKTLGALVRAYHRLPSPRLPVVAQLHRHDALLVSEEARVGIRGVDAWLDRLPVLASATARARWIRLPR